MSNIVVTPKVSEGYNVSIDGEHVATISGYGLR